MRHGQRAGGPTNSAEGRQAGLVGNCGSGCCAGIIHNNMHPTPGPPASMRCFSVRPSGPGGARAPSLCFRGTNATTSSCIHCDQGLY